MDFTEYGRRGQKRYGGIFYEEFLKELQGKRGIAAYQEMSDNDDIIGAILFSIEMLIRQAAWSVQPGGDTPADDEAADFVSSCMDDMQDTWSDTISEILSFLTYGWSAHEIVYKRRCGKRKDPRLNSKYTDNLIGWQKLPIRAQDTLYEWLYDENDNLTGLIQNPPPNYGLLTIPAEKLLLFKTKSRKGNPEGRSILRNAYRCFDEETEILTSNGWRKGMDITIEDSLATLNPGTKQIEYQTPIEVNHYRHKGEMLSFNTRFIDIKVTDNHRMWVKKDGQKDYKIVEASKVSKKDKFMAYGEWCGKDTENYIIPAYNVYQRFRNGETKLKETMPEIYVDMDNWVAFMGLFLSEGCTHLTKNGHGIVSISQKKESTVENIRKLLQKLPFHIYEHKNKKDVIQFEIFDKRLFQELKGFGKSWEVYVPQYIKKLSLRQINIFLDWYWLGDGTTVGNTTYKENFYEGTRQIFTTSAKMADDLQELALLSGHVGRIREKEKQESHFGSRPLYVVTIGKPMDFSAGEINSENYDGYIWCPTTANGIVYVRRNGKAAWVGNCWYFKRRIQEIEGIGIERDLAGFPVLKAPESVNIWDIDDREMTRLRIQSESIVQNIRRDSMEGAVIPYGWELSLLSTGGQRQFDTSAIIERYDSRIAMTCMADFILLGHENVGSFALSSDKTNLFSMAIGSYLDIICEVFNNKGIPSLIDINGDHFAGITDYPKLIHGDVENANLSELGEFISKLTGCGVLIPDEGIEDFVREQAGMPERVSDWDNNDYNGRPEPTDDKTPTQASNPADGKEPPKLDDDIEDLKQAKAAKKRLGRR